MLRRPHTPQPALRDRLYALGGPELLAATHEVVLQHTCSNGPTTTTTSALSTVSSSRSYMQIAAAAMGADLTNVLEEADVTTWRHTLALLCTFASSGDTFRHLASQLANKLEVEGLAAEAASRLTLSRRGWLLLDRLAVDLDHASG